MHTCISNVLCTYTWTNLNKCHRNPQQNRNTTNQNKARHNVCILKIGNLFKQKYTFNNAYTDGTKAIPENEIIDCNDSADESLVI